MDLAKTRRKNYDSMKDSIVLYRAGNVPLRLFCEKLVWPIPRVRRLIIDIGEKPGIKNCGRQEPRWVRTYFDASFAADRVWRDPVVNRRRPPLQAGQPGVGGFLMESNSFRSSQQPRSLPHRKTTGQRRSGCVFVDRLGLAK